MARIHTKDKETPIRCSHFVFYEVFRTAANLLLKVSPRNVKDIKLIDPTTSWVAQVGSRKLVHFDEGGLQYFKDEVVEVKREANKITYKVLEASMMQHYDSLKATLEVTPGTAKWTVEFVKKTPSSPDPDQDLESYLQRLDSVNKDLDGYLSP